MGKEKVHIYKYEQISSNINKYHQISVNIIIIKYQQISSNFSYYHYISLNINKHYQTSTNITKYQQMISSNVNHRSISTLSSLATSTLANPPPLATWSTRWVYKSCLCWKLPFMMTKLCLLHDLFDKTMLPDQIQCWQKIDIRKLVSNNSLWLQCGGIDKRTIEMFEKEAQESGKVLIHFHPDLFSFIMMSTVQLTLCDVMYSV